MENIFDDFMRAGIDAAIVMKAAKSGVSDNNKNPNNSSSQNPNINKQKQDGHVKGTRQAENRLKQGKKTSLFPDRETADKLTQEAWEKGKPHGNRLNVREYDFGKPVNDRGQTRVRVHQDKKGEIHGHPAGPER